MCSCNTDAPQQRNGQQHSWVQSCLCRPHNCAKVCPVGSQAKTNNTISLKRVDASKQEPVQTCCQLCGHCYGQLTAGKHHCCKAVEPFVLPLNAKLRGPETKTNVCSGPHHCTHLRLGSAYKIHAQVQQFAKPTELARARAMVLTLSSKVTFGSGSSGSVTPHEMRTRPIISWTLASSSGGCFRRDSS